MNTKELLSRAVMGVMSLVLFGTGVVMMWEKSLGMGATVGGLEMLLGLAGICFAVEGSSTSF